MRPGRGVDVELVEDGAAAPGAVQRLVVPACHREERGDDAGDAGLERQVAGARLPELLAAADRVADGRRALADVVGQRSRHLPERRPVTGGPGVDEPALAGTRPLRRSSLLVATAASWSPT